MRNWHGLRSPFGSWHSDDRGFNPATLFGATDTGWVYDLSDMSTLFQEAAGITPVTAVGQPVGLQLDKSKGLVLGPELVTNGDFSNGTTGWTAFRSSTISAASGAARVVSNGFTFAGIQRSITTVIGLTYELVCDIVGVTSGVNFGIEAATSDAAGVGSLGSVLSAGAGRKKLIFRATTTTTWVRALCDTNPCDFLVDNISVRELPGNHRSQSASLPRPTYARHPLSGVRNLLTFTEDFTNADWTAGAINLTSIAAGRITPNTTLGQHRYDRATTIAAATHTLSLEVKSDGYNFVWIRLGAIGAVFDATTGAATAVSSGVTATSTSADDGYIRIIISATTAGNDIVRINAATTPTATNFAGDGTSGILIRKAQLETGSTATAYQRVGSAFDVTEAGQPDLYYLSYDGLNDSLSTAPFAWGTDKATICAGVRKLSDAAVGMLAEASVNINTNTGAFRLTAPATVGPSYSFGSRGSGAVIADAIISSGFAAPVTNVITGIGDISGDVSRLRVNGTQVASSTQDQGTGNFGTHAAFFGARAGTSLFFNGREYSNFAINRLLAANELTQLERWTAQRTGVTI